MPARKDVYDPSEVGIYHCFSRCVRQAFLCGEDEESRNDYTYRKDKLESRTAFLVTIFAIEVLDMALMDNHMHHVLRTRPDIAEGWTDDEVVERWWQLHPRRKKDGEPRPMTEKERRFLLGKADMLRLRLANMSWLMKELKEAAAKEFNLEDNVKGHFWAERYKCTRLLDEAAVLACSLYVDLNMIRSGQAQVPEQSRYTSAWHRIQALLGANETPWEDSPRAGDAAAAAQAPPTAERQLPRADAWLSPICESGEPGNATAPRWRASDKGFLPMTVEQYLELLDWTGRQLKRNKRGAIPAHLAPILERLGFVVQRFTETIAALDRFFPRVFGQAKHVAEAAVRAGRQWFKGVSRCRAAFQ